MAEWLKVKAFEYLTDDIKSVMLCFRDENGFNRHIKKNRPAEEIEKDKLLEEYQAMMFWKLACGNPNDPMLYGYQILPELDRHVCI